MKNALKVALFVSAFAPCLISVGIARLWTGAAFWDAIYYIVGGIFGCLSIVYILSALKWYGEEFPFEAKKIESNDALLLGAVVTYILPFFVQAANITFAVVAIIFALLCVFFWLTDAPIPSPLMRILGFRFYKAEAANGMVYTLITRQPVLDPRNVKTVKRISASMLLEVGR